MKITIVGSGYVGLVSGVCFAQMGNQVTCLDTDAHKVSLLSQGISPIYEEGLESLLSDNLKKRTLTFTTDPKVAYQDPQVIFIAVGTPMLEDGSADLSYVLSAARSIGEHLTSYAIIANKSTIPIGTAKRVRECIATELASVSYTHLRAHETHE